MKTVCLTKEQYLTANQVLARIDRKLFCKKKSNDKSRCSTIHYQGDSSYISVKDWPAMDSFSENRNPDQNWPETEA